MNLPDALRSLADFVEEPINSIGYLKSGQRDFCHFDAASIGNDCSYNSFYYNMSNGFRLTGTMAICELFDGEKWSVTQNGLVDVKYQFGRPDYVIVK